MKKFYSCIFVLLAILGITVSAAAQTYMTTTTGGNINDPATWDGPMPDFSSAIGYTIKIYGPVTINIPINFTDSKIIVEPSLTVNINNYVQLYGNSQVLVGANSTVNLNDELDLLDNAVFTLADNGAMLNVLNVAGNTVNGPWGDPALVYFDGGNTFYILSQSGYGQVDPAGYFVTGAYTFNCQPPSTQDCNVGVVWGPATTVPAEGIWEFAQSSPVPLPVTLVQFAATLNPDQTVLLTWSTAQETNSDHFEIQRSTNGTDFKTIGTVKAKGFSSVTTNYSYTDTDPLNSVNYYRLKMVDLDGKTEYSKVITITLNEKPVPLVIYNNPFSDQIRLKVHTAASDNLDLILTDMQGKTFLRQSYRAQNGDNFINIYPPSAAAGLYILSIKGSRYNQTVKLVKQ